MQVALHLPSDKAYLAFCRSNPDLWIERTAQGEVSILPAAGAEADHRNVQIIAALDRWAQKDGRGRVAGPTAQFFLPDGSALSPDAAWVSRDALERTSLRERKTIPHLCPEFVVEVFSPNDRLGRVKAKMEQWIANGVQLAWLIDGDAETVYIYQEDRPVETRKCSLKLAGKAPVKGFTLQLRTIWDGLK
jgi:Uma2 family endonuclease